MSDTATVTAKITSVAPAPTAAGSVYVVLKRHADEQRDDLYSFVRKLAAPTAQEAIRTASNGQEGVYVAVPARSWKPVTVKVEQRTFVKLEDA